MNTIIMFTAIMVFRDNQNTKYHIHSGANIDPLFPHQLKDVRYRNQVDNHTYQQTLI